MALDLDTLARYRQDAFFNNQWRYESAMALDYYDSNQFDADTVSKMQAKGLPLIFVNVMKPTIDTAIGLQERAQTDWIVKPEDDDESDVADILTYRMKQAERATKADRTCLDAMAYMFKGGMGWVEVARQSDPTAYPYAVRRIPYTEMWTDPRSIEVDYSDAQYIRRIRFFERAAVKAAYPAQIALIESQGRGDYTMGWYEPEQFQRNTYLRDLTQVSLDLWGSGRDLIAVEEVQYRENKMGYYFKTRSGSSIAFDQNNPVHILAYTNGIIDPKPAQTVIAKQDIFIGQANLVSRDSPAGMNRFTYVPFVAEREGRTGSPYSPISRSMMPIQDEINTRRAKMAYALQSTRVTATKNAVDDHNLAREEIGRRDAYTILGKNYNPAIDIFKVEDGLGMSKEQMMILQESMAIIPQVSGVPLSLQGVHEGSIDSGRAVQAIGDFGINGLSRINAHAREARRKVGEILLHYNIIDIGKELVEIKGENKQGRKVSVKVNERKVDPQLGSTYIDNNLSAMKLNVVLDDLPHSPTHRTEQFTAIMTALQAMPPQVQAIALPMLVEMSELPAHGKKELADLLRKQLGLGPSDDSPEGIAAAEQAKQAQQAAQAKHQEDMQLAGEQQHQAALGESAAKTQASMASAEKLRAAAAKDLAAAEKLQEETQRLRATPIGM